MSKLFIDTYKKRPLLVNGGSGPWLYTDRNKKYIDFLSGISINNIGYGNDSIARRIIIQTKKIIHPSNYYFTKPQIELAQKLVDISQLDKVFFANSGTEANEAALIFLEKYKEKVRPHRDEIIIFDGSFLGRTYGCRRVSAGLSVGHFKIKKIPFNNLVAFKNSVSRKTLVVHLELVLGHGGIRPMELKNVREIAKICHEKDILIYIDEIQTGLGRIGEIFAFKLYGLRPDIVTIGKSLGGGLPLSATLVKERIAKNINPGDYGATMGGNSLACVAGMVMLEYISNPRNIQKINEKGAYIIKRINDLRIKYPQIKEIRGLGLMLGVELTKKADEVLKYCIESGLLIDIVNQNTLRLLPPFNTPKKDIDLAIDKLSASLSKVYL